jgi:hypothetical protein
MLPAPAMHSGTLLDSLSATACNCLQLPYTLLDGLFNAPSIYMIEGQTKGSHVPQRILALLLLHASIQVLLQKHHFKHCHHICHLLAINASSDTSRGVPNRFFLSFFPLHASFFFVLLSHSFGD